MHVMTLERLLRSLSMDQFSRNGDDPQNVATHYSVVSGQVDPKDSNYSDLPLIAPNHIESGTGRITEIESASQQAAISGKYLFDQGAVIYSKIRSKSRQSCDRSMSWSYVVPTCMH